MTDSFPHHGAEITCAFLTAALRQARVIEDDSVSVASFTFSENTGFGAVSSSGFVSVVYSDASSSTAALPTRFFVKFASADPGLAARFEGVLYKEVEFYRRQPAELHALCPRVFFIGWQTQPTVAMCMLMEDLAAQGYTHACREFIMPHAAIALMLRKLAALHATFWNKLDPVHGWPALLGGAAGSQDLSSLVQPFDAQWEKVGRPMLAALWTPETLQACDVIRGHWPLVYQLVSQPPLVLSHGDAHGENWLLRLGDDDAKLCDWQCYRQWTPLADVQVCLASGLETPDRREHERAFVRLYHDELVRLGVRDYTYDQAWWDYRFLAGEPLLRFAIIVFLMNSCGLDKVRRSAVRFAQVAHDHNALGFFRALVQGTLVRYQEPPPLLDTSATSPV